MFSRTMHRRENTCGRGVFKVISHVITCYTNASRGLSAIAEFLIYFLGVVFPTFRGLML